MATDSRTKLTAGVIVNESINFSPCIIIALLFLLIFSDTTSPLFSKYHIGIDSIFYMQNGKRLLYQLTNGISTSGISPMSLIQAVGQAIYNGRPGAFIMQLVFFASFIYITIKLLGLKIKKYYYKAIILLVAFIFLAMTFEGGNLQEEFALPVIVLCLYIGLKDYIWNDRKSNPPFNAFIFGLSFGLLLFLKVISVATLCAIILTIVLDLGMHKNTKNLLQNLGYGFLGLAAAIIPIIIYGLLNDTLRLIISRNFFSGVTYVIDSKPISLSSRYHLFVFVPIMASVFSAFLERNNRRYVIFVISNAIIMAIALYAGRSYLHYATLNVATLIVALAVIFKEENTAFVYNYITKHNLIKLFAVIVLLGFISFSAIPVRLINRQLGMDSFLFNDSQLDNPFAEIIAVIPAEELNEVLAYDVSPAWYYVTNTIPYGDYIGYWMSYYASVNPDVKEIVDSIIASNPLWIIINTGKSDSNIFLQEQLDAKYNLVYTTYIEGYRGTHEVYKLK